MNTPKLSPADAKATALKTLESLPAPFVSFATSGTDGWSDLRMMAIAAHDGVDTLWFGTSTESKKAAQLKVNPKAVVYGYDPGSMKEFRLFGKIELLSDAASRRKIWQDDFLQYFPEGVDSPTFLVMKFMTERGESCGMDGMGTF